MSQLSNFIVAGWDFYKRFNHARRVNRAITSVRRVREEMKQTNHLIGRWLASTTFEQRNDFLERHGFPRIKPPCGVHCG